MRRRFIQAIIQIFGVLTTGVALAGLVVCGIMLVDGHWWASLAGLGVSILSFMAVDWLANLSIGARMM